MKHWISFSMLLLCGLIGCEASSDKLSKMELEKRSWEPSARVKEWVEKEYDPPRVDKPVSYYLYNLDNPKIGMHKSEFVPNFISFEDVPMLMRNQHISSTGVMETWQYGRSMSHPWVVFTFLDDKLITIFRH